MFNKTPKVTFLNKIALWLFGPPKDVPDGEYVAEAFINWEICSGPTLYRARFKTQDEAEFAARGAAWLLDQMLPTGYAARDALNRRYIEPYNFEIKWGLRKGTPAELKPGKFRPVWSPVLRGDPGFSGDYVRFG
jgi:hypothetical protein